MHTIEKKEIVPFAPQKVYQLITNIEAYPHFLPLCQKVRILDRIDTNTEITQMDMKILSFDFSIITRNTYIPFEKVDILLEKGPFHSFETHWFIEELETRKTKVILHMRYELNLPTHIDKIIIPLFKAASASYIDAFLNHAYKLYGRSSDTN